MPLQNAPELRSFFTTYIAEASPEADGETVQSFLTSASPEKQQQVLIQAKEWIVQSASLVETLGMEANRWFADADEARSWMQNVIDSLEKNAGTQDQMTVSDSNGTPLQDGDAVQVIKDLKVKGGSSDLKRGTLIKKIRLIGDPDNIECNVDGSTLVLKTCFLKKA